MKRLITLLSIFLTFYYGVAQESPPNEIIYHVCQRSFYDSNGDLHGDLKGLEQKLDYLQELGVTSILLLPLYESVYYHNYFPSDFEKIDPEFGTTEDYIHLVREIHRRGMKIYMDMETQYITEDHLWYKDSYQNPQSEFTEYLIYNGPNNTDPETIIFDLTELEGYDGTVRKITTIDLRNEKVTRYIYDLYKYWVDPNNDGDFSDGVDGYRIDHMMDDLDWKGKITGLLSGFWKPLFDDIRTINPNIKIVGEQADWFKYAPEYFTDADIDRLFAFGIQIGISSFSKSEIVNKIDSTFQFTPNGKDQLIFLENHDTRRFASAVNSDQGKLRVGAAINLLLPGIPVIYYGQEIGMTGEGGFGVFGNSDANDIPRREAFEWYSAIDRQGMALWYKNTGPAWDQRNIKDGDGISVEEQSGDPNSLLNYYRQLILLRKVYPALNKGGIQFIENHNSNVISFIRSAESQRILVNINLSKKMNQITMDDLPGDKHWKSLLPDENVETISRGRPFLVDPFEVQVLLMSD